MIMPSRNVRDQLAFAAGSGQIVRVYRDEIEVDGVDAFIAASGKDLVLLNTVSEAVQVDGFEVVFIDDISEIEMPHPREAFLSEALELRGMARLPAPDVDLDTLPGFLRSVGEVATLVTFYREMIDLDACFVGIPRGCDDRFVTLTEISPNAEYEPAPTRILLEEITRLNFATLYEDALEKVAKARGHEPPNST